MEEKNEGWDYKEGGERGDQRKEENERDKKEINVVFSPLCFLISVSVPNSFNYLFLNLSDCELLNIGEIYKA